VKGLCTFDKLAGVVEGFAPPSPPPPVELAGGAALEVVMTQD
jgi:hypothetical protein